MTKTELKIIGGLIILALLILAGYFIYRQIDNRQLVLKVTAQHKTVAVLPMNQDYRHTFKTKAGQNTVVIKNGRAYVSKADCKNQICVHSHPISENGETIACLPHRLILTITTKGGTL
ncbi:NusG domain II-containing protein [Pseudoramibacter faecis]|uniref:NusG domain II-containing protein n=1 Tax=Pseudoramibacter faecis TaxID=3108534 RepID=UPI002E7A54F9|nr:NusG domain II-containing protein [Pseudoramibacter sp. HA2172]